MLNRKSEVTCPLIAVVITTAIALILLNSLEWGGGLFKIPFALARGITIICISFTFYKLTLFLCNKLIVNYKGHDNKL